jgi:hypothetical protein
MRFVINRSHSGFRLSDEACNEIIKRNPDVCLALIERNDHDLVETVERLGFKANGNGAKLVLVDIPDEIAIHERVLIHEEDGFEFAYEMNSVWGLNVYA